MEIEVVRANRELYAFITTQNEWTGNYITNVRKVRLDGNNYVVRVDGKLINVNDEVRRLMRYEDNISEWHKFYKENYR